MTSSSLRLRLLLGTSLAMTGVLAALGLATYFLNRQTLLAQFDGAMLTEARALAAMTEQNGRRMKFEFDPQQMPEFEASRRPAYFEIRLGSGRVMARSKSLGGKDLVPAAAGGAAAATPPNGRAVDITLPDGHRGRLIALGFTPRVEHDPEDEADPAGAPAAQSAVVLVARATGALHETLENLRWLLVTLCGTAVVVSGAVLMVVVRRALRPVNRLARTIGDMRETDLSRRLGIEGVPAELVPVVDRLNALLARLEEAFARERAFTADVAHELRTPIAGLRTTLEVARSRPREPAAYQATIDKCLAISGRMEAMVGNLLLLARAEAGQLPVNRQPFDLCELLRDCWTFDARAAARGLRVRWHLPQTCVVETDREKLRLVVQNLMENAVSYADDGGTVRVEVAPRDDGPAVTIANTGSRLSSDDLPRVFERFWRGDAARSDTGVHCGLGLSLCQRLGRLLNLRLDVRTTPGGEFIVRLELPPSSPPTSQPHPVPQLHAPAPAADGAESFSA